MEISKKQTNMDIEKELAKKIIAEEEEIDNRTFGERVADRVADFGGSWTFIISFITFIIIWIAVNVFIYVNQEFDPYPFILLNLILSCVASLQAPIIMMSQNRQEDKDRERAKKDFEINLRSEMEICELNRKLDMIMKHYKIDVEEKEN